MLEQGVVGFYANQEIYSDIRQSLDFKQGVTLELFLSDPERFGRKTEPGEVVDVTILARDHRGKPIYLSHAPVAFPRERILTVQMRRALRNFEHN